MELTDFGALDRRPDGRFTVGLRLWQLGTLAPLTEALRTPAQPFLEDLCTALHQHVQLAVLEGQEAVIIERLSAPEAPALVSQAGGRLPLHCTGVDKVLLSHGGTELIETVLSGELREYSSRSIVAPEVLRKEITDNAAAAAMVVGGRVVRPMDLDVRWVAATLAKNGVIEESGVSAAVMGHPAAGIAWLGNKLAAVGQHLKAGQMLLSGSFTRQVSVEANTVVHADFGPLGSIGVAFQ
jgi:hypothetical protein